MPSVQRSIWPLSAVTLSVVAGSVASTAAAGFFGSVMAATIVGIAAAALVLGLLLRHPPDARLEGVPAGIRRLSAVGALLLIVEIPLATAFILDPTVARWEGRPWTPQRSAHSCVSSYWVACANIRGVRDIYAEELYSVPQADPAAVRVARPIGPLLIDQFEYPPAFLVLPRVIAAATPDFWSFRRVWFAVNLAVVVAGLILVARRFDDVLGTHALWLTSFGLLAPPVMITFLMGNVQLAIIAASMIAMLLFERQRYAAGGALLAYAVVSKLYPGLLVLYLLLRRDWRASGWTALFSVALVLISIADFGLGPYAAFAQHMPKLLSGEAFPAFRNPTAMAINESIPGLVFKLKLFGVPHMGFAAAKAVGWIYTLVAIALTARLALRSSAPGREPLAWLAILILATMRSPFLPTYGPFPALWLATLLCALTWGRSRTAIASAAAWCVLAFTFGTGGAPPAVNAISTFTHTVAAFALVAITLRVVAVEAQPAAGPPHHGSVLA